MASMIPNNSSGSGSSTTVVETQQQQTGAEQVASEVVRLKLNKPSQQPQKKVSWTQSTVDNENMGKKKSKCCCVYVKPREFDESESDTSDDECDNCSGHVERRGKRPPTQGGSPPEGGGPGIVAAS